MDRAGAAGGPGRGAPQLVEGGADCRQGTLPALLGGVRLDGTIDDRTHVVDAGRLEEIVNGP